MGDVILIVAALIIGVLFSASLMVTGAAVYYFVRDAYRKWTDTEWKFK